MIFSMQRSPEICFSETKLKYFPEISPKKKMNKKLNWKNMLLSELSPRELSGTVSFRAFFFGLPTPLPGRGYYLQPGWGYYHGSYYHGFLVPTKILDKKRNAPKILEILNSVFVFFWGFFGWITFSVFFFEKYSTQIAIVYSLITPYVFWNK